MADSDIEIIDLTADSVHSSPVARFLGRPAQPTEHHSMPASHHYATPLPSSGSSAYVPLAPASARPDNKRKRREDTPPSTPLQLNPFYTPDGKVIETPTYLSSVAQTSSPSQYTTATESLGSRVKKGMKGRKNRNAQKEREKSPCEEHVANHPRIVANVRACPPSSFTTTEAEEWRKEHGFLQMFDNAFVMPGDPILSLPAKKKIKTSEEKGTMTMSSMTDTFGTGHSSMEPSSNYNMWATRPSTNFADLLIEYNKLSRKYDTLQEEHELLKDEANLFKGENEVLLADHERMKKRMKELQAKDLFSM